MHWRFYSLFCVIWHCVVIQFSRSNTNLLHLRQSQIIRNALSDGCQESETGSPLKAANINCSWKCQWRYIIIYESFKWAVNAKTQRMAKNIVKYWQLATAIGPEVSFVATAARSAMTYGHHSQRVLRFIDQFSFERLQICT